MSTNARECTAIVRQQVFSVVPYFYTNEETPGVVFDGKFSRIDITLVDKQQNNGHRPFVKSVIREDALPGIQAKSKYAFNKYMDYKYSNAGNSSQNSPAYTVQLTGKLKGKTPAAILSEDPVAGKETLNSQYKWLKDNVDKYPANREQMEAIVDASNLLKEGRLEKTQSGPVIEIYQAMHGNPYKKNDKGLYSCHDTKIVVNTAAKYPVEITISNFWAALNKDATGRQTVNFSTAEDKITVTMNLTMEEWIYNLDQIENARQRFLMMNAKNIEATITAKEKTAKAVSSTEKTA